MASQQPIPNSSDVLAEAAADAQESARPKLLLFHSPTSGRSRKAEAFLAQVLQRRHNHETFRLVRVNADSRPDLAERLQVTALPTLLVVEGRRIRARIETPRSRVEIEQALRPWLR